MNLKLGAETNQKRMAKKQIATIFSSQPKRFRMSPDKKYKPAISAGEISI
jgi:hypothetical protein